MTLRAIGFALALWVGASAPALSAEVNVARKKKEAPAEIAPDASMDGIELPPDNPLCPVRYIGPEGAVVCGAIHFLRGVPVEVERRLAERLVRTGKFEAR